MEQGNDAPAEAAAALAALAAEAAAAGPQSHGERMKLGMHRDRDKL
jgi:hypothetical protein